MHHTNFRPCAKHLYCPFKQWNTRVAHTLAKTAPVILCTWLLPPSAAAPIPERCHHMFHLAACICVEDVASRTSWDLLFWWKIIFNEVCWWFDKAELLILLCMCVHAIVLHMVFNIKIIENMPWTTFGLLLSYSRTTFLRFPNKFQ